VGLLQVQVPDLHNGTCIRGAAPQWPPLLRPTGEGAEEPPGAIPEGAISDISLSGISDSSL
jgi:hypothetical protein